MTFMLNAFYDPAATATLVPVLDADEVANAFGCSAATALGAGTFGETWHINHSVHGSVAVKIIKDANYPPERLAREIEGLRRANCSHVVKLLDTPTVSLSIGDRAALMFEYIPGGDLASHLFVGPSHDQVRDFALALTAGVAELHAHQCVHRDIKPENITLRNADWADPVLLDLGLAKVLDQASVTAYPAILGTVPFMAPEQLRGERVGQLADMFAVGVILYILLADRHPYYGLWRDRVDQVTAIQLLEAGPPPLPAAVPADLDALTIRLLNPAAYKRGSAVRALNSLNEGVQS